MKKTVLGTAFTLLIAAFTFTSCNSSEANDAEKIAPLGNTVNKEQAPAIEIGNPIDTLNTKKESNKKEKDEANEKEEKEEKD